MRSKIRRLRAGNLVDDLQIQFALNCLNLAWGEMKEELDVFAKNDGKFLKTVLRKFKDMKQELDEAIEDREELKKKITPLTKERDRLVEILKGLAVSGDEGKSKDVVSQIEDTRKKLDELEKKFKKYRRDFGLPESEMNNCVHYLDSQIKDKQKAVDEMERELRDVVAVKYGDERVRKMFHEAFLGNPTLLSDIERVTGEKINKYVPQVRDYDFPTRDKEFILETALDSDAVMKSYSPFWKLNSSEYLEKVDGRRVFDMGRLAADVSKGDNIIVANLIAFIQSRLDSLFKKALSEFQQTRKVEMRDIDTEAGGDVSYGEEDWGKSKRKDTEHKLVENDKGAVDEVFSYVSDRKKDIAKDALSGFKVQVKLDRSALESAAAAFLATISRLVVAGRIITDGLESVNKVLPDVLKDLSIAGASDKEISIARKCIEMAFKKYVALGIAESTENEDTRERLEGLADRYDDATRNYRLNASVSFREMVRASLGMRNVRVASSFIRVCCSILSPWN